MVQDVYADLLFLINFSMDYLCFFICSRILQRKLMVKRVLLAAALGGIYSVVSLFLPISSWGEIALDCAVGFVLCVISFADKNRGSSSLLLSAFLFIGVSMMMGGCMTVLFNLLNKLSLPISSISQDGVSTYIFALLAAIAGVFSLKGGQAISRRSSISEYTLHVRFCGKDFTFSGFADSGNLVRDPLSGKSVIFVERSIMEKELSLEFLDDFARGKFDPNSPCKNLRVISIHTASGSSLAVAAFTEKICAEFTDKKGRVVSIELDSLISPTDIGKNAKGYNAIIPSEIIKL